MELGSLSRRLTVAEVLPWSLPGCVPCQHLDLRFLVSVTVTECVSAVEATPPVVMAATGSSFRVPGPRRIRGPAYCLVGWMNT